MTEETKRVLNDPTTSYWLSIAIIELLQKDPLDARHDAETLFHLLDNEVKNMLASQTTV